MYHEMAVYDADLIANLSADKIEKIKKLAGSDFFSFRNIDRGDLRLHYNGRDVGRHYLKYLSELAGIMGNAAGEIQAKVFYVGDEEYEEIERYRIRDGRLEMIEKRRLE